MGLNLISPDLHLRFQIEERRHACAVLASDFSQEFDDLLECLRRFQLARSEIIVGGGRKSKIAERFDSHLESRGWKEKKTGIEMIVDGVKQSMETHQVDFFKNHVAVEVEWNNKDPFYSRDLNAFRLLHELSIISVGVIITRCDELQELFDSLGMADDGKPIGKKYGSSTTHWGKLMPRVNAGGGGGCPLLLVGIRKACYVDDMPGIPLCQA